MVALPPAFHPGPTGSEQQGVPATRTMGGMVRKELNLQKIAIAWLLVQRTPAVGGTPTHIRAWIRGLDRSRFEAFFIGWGDEAAIRSFLEPCGPVTLIRLPVLAYLPWTYPIAILQVARELRRHRIAVIHSANPMNDVLAWAAATISGRTATICSIEGALMPAWLSRPKAFIFRRACRAVLPRMNRLVALSHAAGLQAAQFLRIDPGRIAVVYPGIVSDDFATAGEGIDRPLRVGAMSRLDRDKAMDRFLEVAAVVSRRCPNVVFLIGGDGTRRAELEMQARSLRIDHCTEFLGFVDPREFLSRIDVFGHCSVAEGLGWVLLEAMAAGRPVVASDVGGIPEVIQDGETGFLVPVNDVEAMAERIVLLLNNTAMRKTMGEAGRRFVEERFTARRESVQFQRLYLEVARRD